MMGVGEHPGGWLELILEGSSDFDHLSHPCASLVMVKVPLRKGCTLTLLPSCLLTEPCWQMAHSYVFPSHGLFENICS